MLPRVGPRQAVDERVEVDGVKKCRQPKRWSACILGRFRISRDQGKANCHAPTHSLVLQILCAYCIRGRGEATPNARAERDRVVPNVHMDNCFCGGQSEEALRILCGDR